MTEAKSKGQPWFLYCCVATIVMFGSVGYFVEFAPCPVCKGTGQLAYLPDHNAAADDPSTLTPVLKECHRCYALVMNYFLFAGGHVDNRDLRFIDYPAGPDDRKEQPLTAW